MPEVSLRSLRRGRDVSPGCPDGGPEEGSVPANAQEERGHDVIDGHVPEEPLLAAPAAAAPPAGCSLRGEQQQEEELVVVASDF